jgi:Fur family ferric uptake transcriptional regulator
MASLKKGAAKKLNPNQYINQHQDTAKNDSIHIAMSQIKQTKPRRQILAVLEQAEQPLSAVEIQSRAENSGDKIWLSTVYRVLDLFVERDIAIKSTLLDQDMAVYGLNRYEHKHYAVCVGCHKIVAMSNCPMADFDPMLKDSRFRVIGHKIEIYGYCNECQDKRDH